MELFFFLLGLLLLAFPIIAVVALVKSIGLGERLFRAEALRRIPCSRARRLVDDTST
jgi:hypothetical protein